MAVPVEVTASVAVGVAQTVDGEDIVAVAAAPQLQMVPAPALPPNQPQCPQLNQTHGTFLPPPTKQMKMHSRNPSMLLLLRSRSHPSLPHLLLRLGPACSRPSPSQWSPSPSRSLHRLQRSPRRPLWSHRSQKLHKNLSSKQNSCPFQTKLSKKPQS